MKVQKGADYTFCMICGEKLPWYISLCPRCHYMLLSLRQKMDQELPMTGEEADAILNKYYSEYKEEDDEC